MSKLLSNDNTAKKLLGKLSDDVSSMKSELAELISHHARTTLPKSARELADYSREKFHSQLQHLRAHPRQSSAGIVGGLVLLGAVGFGIYYLCKSDCCGSRCDYRDDADTGEDDRLDSRELPSYIS